MAELSRFFGIIIRMYAEMNAPHHTPHKLGGEGIEDKARELLAYLSRRHNVVELINIAKKLRPDISWKNMDV